jgi:CrcB protein
MDGCGFPSSRIAAIADVQAKAFSATSLCTGNMENGGMNSVILVALGGALGSVCRFLLSSFVSQRAVDWRFPLGTFAVNMVGCLLIGLLLGLSMKEGYFSTETRLFLFTGIVGGFTTFSAFELETFMLLRSGEFLVAGGNVLLSVSAGLLSLWAGFACVSRFSS